MAYLDIMHRAAFEDFVLSLPSTTLVRQWRDDSVAKIGGKIFCLLDRDPGEIWLKVSPLSFEAMRDTKGIRPAPYFARAGWLAISHESPLTEAEVRAYIEQAYALIAAKLPKRVRAELDLNLAQ